MTEREDLEVLEQQLGKLLFAGVTLSTLAMAAGLLTVLVAGAGVVATHLLTLGVVLLIGTPVARVVVSSVACARRRDWTFLLLTLVVLGELTASFVAAVRK